ncbi:carbon-nitrogen hydrolase family protein [Kiloniella sp.]|uniref:carbon-nitrogen hydrolase family protein n=1 Tax=Kiloniella sp. TaxID=1938587 RepID=UPI003B01A1F3
MEKTFNLAVAQSPGELSGPEERLHWLSSKLKELDGKTVDLLLLPELFLTGYNVGERLMNWAEPCDGPMALRISELATKHNIAIHYGFPERRSDGVYNAAQCIGSDGQQLSIHRKLILPPGFEGDHFQAGKGCNLFDLNGFKIATLICYDAEFPEAFRHVASLGAQLVLVPTALGAQWGVVAQKVVPTRAFENGVYVAYANQAGSEGDMTYYGGSCVISPNGEEDARAGDNEEILIASLSTSKVLAAQKRLPYLSDLKRIDL